MMAPVNEKGSQDKDPLYRLLAQLEAEKADHETARLLYVATTRAVNRLHLLGHARVDRQGKAKAQSGSLLEQMWPLVVTILMGAKRRSLSAKDGVSRVLNYVACSPVGSSRTYLR